MTSNTTKSKAAKTANRRHIDTRVYNALAVAIRNAQILRLARADAERALNTMESLQSDQEATEALRKAVLIITRQMREAERTVTAAIVTSKKESTHDKI